MNLVGAAGHRGAAFLVHFQCLLVPEVGTGGAPITGTAERLTCQTALNPGAASGFHSHPLPGREPPALNPLYQALVRRKLTE